jgi:hypothetical protein
LTAILTACSFVCTIGSNPFISCPNQITFTLNISSETFFFNHKYANTISGEDLQKGNHIA